MRTSLKKFQNFFPISPFICLVLLAGCATRNTTPRVTLTIAIGSGSSQEKITITDREIAVETFFMNIKSGEKVVNNWHGRISPEERDTINAILTSPDFPKGEDFKVDPTLFKAGHWLITVKREEKVTSTIFVAGKATPIIFNLLATINRTLPPSYQFALPLK